MMGEGSFRPDGDRSTDSAQPAGRRGSRPALALVLLCLLNAASLLDAMILALLMAPIKAALSVSDTQLALLFGLAFALCYVVVSIPLASIADKGNRKHLLLWGVATWSVMTMASALAWNFTSLFVARAGVAVGEAVLLPIAVSMIADLYPANRRAVPTSIMLTVRAVMSQGALVVGGGAVALAMLASHHLGIETWRLTFVVVALPGILTAIAFACFIAEPARRDPGTADAAISLAAAARHLLAQAPLYLGLFIGVSALCAASILMVAWMPTMFIREYRLTAAAAGLAYGIPALAGAVAGTLGVPLLLQRLGNRSRTESILIIAAIGLAMVPAAPLLLAFGDARFVEIGIAIATMGALGASVLPSILVQSITPPRFRARLIATFLTMMTLLGQGLGPSLVTLLAAGLPGMPLSATIARAVWLMVGLAAVSLATAATWLVRTTINSDNAVTE